MRVRLPQPGDKVRKKNDEVFEYLTQLVKALEGIIERLPEQPFTRDRIVVTNNTKTYALDATAATLDETRKVLGTLLVQLQESGKIS